MTPSFDSGWALGALVLLVSALGCSSAADATSPGRGGSVEIRVSGEALGTEGFRFPSGSEGVLSDGWQLDFSHVLVTVSEVTLSENPDAAPSDQSKTGAVVARATGPWAADLHREGTAPGVGGEGTAVPVTVMGSENENGNAAFASDERYALGYRTAAASARARKLNFDGDAETEALYDRMIAEGYSVLYAGTATFRGEGCKTTDAAYDFDAFPTSVPFELGFRAPTTYLNCQNQENQGDAFAGEAYERGVAVPANAPAVAQLTFHLDHAFYSDVQHEPRLHFDQIAAQLVGKPPGSTVTTDDLTRVDPTAFTDGAGERLPFRVCDGTPLPDRPQMGFAVGSLPVDPGADPSSALRNYGDFITYVTSSQGHLNGGEGLCYAQRDFRSP